MRLSTPLLPQPISINYDECVLILGQHFDAICVWYRRLATSSSYYPSDQAANAEGKRQKHTFESASLRIQTICLSGTVASHLVDAIIVPPQSHFHHWAISGVFYFLVNRKSIVSIDFTFSSLSAHLQCSSVSVSETSLLVFQFPNSTSFKYTTF